MAMTTSRTMNAMNKIKYALIALATLAVAACSTKEFDEKTDLNLSRCLNLNRRCCRDLYILNQECRLHGIHGS